MSGFHRDGLIQGSLSPAESSVLRELTDELLRLLGQADHHDDPLAAVVGISTNDRPPEDPALARLLPDAYQNPEHAGEFRRYTEHGLREGKRARLEELQRNLGSTDSGVSLSWDDQTAQRMAMSLNDIRLFLGTRLDISPTADEEFELLADDDPRKAGFAVFSWIGWLQQTLVDALIS